MRENASRSPTEIWRRLIPSLPALVVYSAIALPNLWSQDLWYDELFTADASSRGLSGLVDHLWEFPRVPFYAVMMAWTGSGYLSADWWIQLLPFVLVLSSIVLTSMIARFLGGAKAAFIAPLVFSLNPLLVFHGTDANPYPLGIFLVSLSTYFLVRLKVAENGEIASTRNFNLYILSTGLVALFYLPGLIALLPQLVFGGNQLWRDFRKAWHSLLNRAYLLVTLLPIVGLAVLSYVSRGEVMHSWLAVPQLGDLGGGLGLTGFEYALPLAVAALLTRTGSKLLVGTIGGVGIIWIVSQLGSSWWISRTFLPLSSFLAIAAALVVARISWWQVTALAALLALVVLPQLAPSADPGAANLESSAAKVFAKVGPVSAIVISENPALGFALDRYASEKMASLFKEQPVESLDLETWVLSSTNSGDCAVEAEVTSEYQWLRCDPRN